MATFIGDYPCKVDVKGRIILPMAFKKQMPADAPDHFVVKKDIFVDCLILYTIDDWNSQVDMIRKHTNPYNRVHNEFLRNFFKGTAELAIDNNNRLLIPKRLLELINAGRDVTLAGQPGKIEIWPTAVYDEIKMAPNVFADTAENILGGTLNEPFE
jgi:MraZ protein